MAEADLYIQRALGANALREPVLRSVIQSLDLPTGSRGLDAGCGIGLQASLLAEAVGPTGHVTGLDILPSLLAYGEHRALKAGLSKQIEFREGDVNHLPFDDHCFDWVWSADCAGYPAGGFMPVLQEMVRVLKPGGSLILLGWSSQQLLPGYPLLEARLNSSCSAYIPFLKGREPGSHFMRALGWFQQTGLEECTVRTFVGEVEAPLERAERAALISLFNMLWGEPQAEVSAEDWAQFKQLYTPESPDFILNLPDYYAFFTYTVFRGRIPQR